MRRQLLVGLKMTLVLTVVTESRVNVLRLNLALDERFPVEH
jgi:hypothetical protein